MSELIERPELEMTDPEREGPREGIVVGIFENRTHIDLPGNQQIRISLRPRQETIRHSCIGFTRFHVTPHYPIIGWAH